MARYEHLPVYKAAMDTALFIEQMVRNFSRSHKYTTGQELRNLARDIIKLVIRANSAHDKGNGELQGVSAGIESGSGVCRHADSYRLKQAIFLRNSWLSLRFLRDGDRLIPRNSPRGMISSMRKQVRYFHRHVPGFIILFEVGRYVEAYGREPFW